jgi:quinol monooxygenase YgiN
LCADEGDAMTTEADSDSTVFVFVRLHASPDRHEDVRAVMNRVVIASRTEPGCVSMHGFRSFRDPGLFFIHSVWKDTRAFEVHAEFPHTVEFLRDVDPMLDEPRAVSRTQKIV